MNRIKILFPFTVLLLSLSVISCGSQSTPMTPEPSATAHTYPDPMYDPNEIAASLTAIPEEPVDADAAEPTEAPQTEPTEVVAAETEVDNCLDCHTDQQTLIDTADPVAEVVSENEGEG